MMLRAAGALLCVASVVIASPALANDDCPDISTSLESAWALFNDAEVNLAAQAVEQTSDRIACQSRVLTSEELLSLYELDALLSLAQGDEDGAVSAVIRTVAADPEGTPDASRGPKLAELHATWRRRLAAARLVVKVDGDYAAHIDGVLVRPGDTYETLEGSHVLQWKTDDGLHTEVTELTGDHTVFTTPPDADDIAAETEATLTPPPAPIPPKKKKEKRTRSGPPGTPALWGTGLGLAAAGGGAILTGFLLDRQFQDTSYALEDFGGDRAAAEDAIRQDAQLVNILYGVGYGLAGAGAIMTGVGFGVSPKAGGAEVTVAVRF